MSLTSLMAAFTAVVGDAIKAQAGVAVGYATAIPSVPSWGKGRFFVRDRGRLYPAYVDSSGYDTCLQDHFGPNKVAIVAAVPNSTAPTAWGTVPIYFSGGGSVPVAFPPQPTNFYTRFVRFRLATTAAATVTASVRGTTAVWCRSATPNAGGFHAVFRFGLGTGQTGHKAFIGLSSTTGVLAANVNPSTFRDCIGVVLDTADTTLSFFTADSTTGVKTALGASFPFRSNQSDFYELTLFVASGDSSKVAWAVRHLNDNIVASGVATANLPTLEAMLTFQAMVSTASLAAVVNLDVQSIYIQTDN